MGNPLIAWTPSNIFTMKRPLESGAGGGEEIVLMDENRAIVEYKVLQNSHRVGCARGIPNCSIAGGPWLDDSY